MLQLPTSAEMSTSRPSVETGRDCRARGHAGLDLIPPGGSSRGVGKRQGPKQGIVEGYGSQYRLLAAISSALLGLLSFGYGRQAETQNQSVRAVLYLGDCRRHPVEAGTERPKRPTAGSGGIDFTPKRWGDCFFLLVGKS